MDSLEENTKANVLEWIDSGVELCRLEKPATPARHLVSYFVVLDRDHLLLVDHINAQLWLPTGGHVEPDEHPKETVVREAKEELNLESCFLLDAPLFLTISETVGLTAGHTDVSLWYVLNGDKNQVLEYDRTEFNNVSWFHFDAVPLRKSDPEMSRFLQKLCYLQA